MLESSPQSAGRHHLAWDGRLEEGARAPSGIYMARLRVAGNSIVRRVVLTR